MLCVQLKTSHSSLVITLLPLKIYIILLIIMLIYYLANPNVNLSDISLIIS